MKKTKEILITLSYYRILIPAIALAIFWTNLIPNEPVSDQYIYHIRATSLSSGEGYVTEDGKPTAYWAAGYAFYLSLFYKAFGASYQVAFLANTLSYIALVAGIFTVCSHWYGKKVGELMAICTMVYPTFLMYTTIIASELLFLSLITWVFYFTIRIVESEDFSLKWVIGTGLILGLANFVRPVAQVLPMGFLAFAKIKKKPTSTSLLQTLIIGLVMILVCVPWGLRNKQELGKFVLVSTNFGANFWMGNNENTQGTYQELPPEAKKLTEVDRDNFLKHEAFNFLLQNLDRVPELTFKRLYNSLKSETSAVYWNSIGIKNSIGLWAHTPLRVLTTFFYYALIFFVLFKLYLYKKNILNLQEYEKALICFIILLFIPITFIVGCNRYHLPIIPFLIMFLGSLISYYSSFIEKTFNRKFIRYLIVGFLVVTVDFLTYQIILLYQPSVVAKAVSFMCAAFTSFGLNKLWTFKSLIQGKIQFIRFCILYSFTFALNILCNEWVLTTLPSFYTFAFTVTTFVCVIWNYIGQHYWVFQQTITPPND